MKQRTIDQHQQKIAIACQCRPRAPTLEAKFIKRQLLRGHGTLTDSLQDKTDDEARPDEGVDNRKICPAFSWGREMQDDVSGRVRRGGF